MRKIEHDNQETCVAEYSALGKVFMIGLPVLFYVFIAKLTVAFKLNIIGNDQLMMMDLSIASALFLLRVGAMVMIIFASMKAFFSVPKEKTPLWMVVK